MRLIDVDAFKKWLLENSINEREEKESRQIGIWIDAFPSAETERKKGKWIYKHFVWFCSKCGENPTKGMGYVQGQYELYNFCPNCGCQMNGGEQE